MDLSDTLACRYYPEAEAWPAGLKRALESDLRTPLASSAIGWAALGAVVNILKVLDIQSALPSQSRDFVKHF